MSVSPPGSRVHDSNADEPSILTAEGGGFSLMALGVIKKGTAHGDKKTKRRFGEEKEVEVS